MDSFSVTLEAQGRLEHASALDRLAEVLADVSPSAVASWGGLAGGPGVTMSIEAEGPQQAVEGALNLFAKSLAEAGIPPARIERVGVMTDDYQAKWLAEEPDALIGVTEVAELLGVSRQRVAELRQRSDFPKPTAEIAAGPIWMRKSLNQFIAGWERKPGRRRMDRSGTMPR